MDRRKKIALVVIILGVIIFTVALIKLIGIIKQPHPQPIPTISKLPGFHGQEGMYYDSADPTYVYIKAEDGYFVKTDIKVTTITGMDKP